MTDDEATFGGAKQVALRSGHTLTCGIDRNRGTYWVALDGADRQRIEQPIMRAGIGGVELVVSPDERYAALFVYSGQSEQGYDLFELAPKLRQLDGLAYVPGEGLAPFFAPDSRRVAMAITQTRMIRGTEEYAEELLDPDADPDEEILVDWAALYVQDLPAGTPRRTPIGTDVPASADIDDIEEWNLYEPSRFVGPDRIRIPLPWGTHLDVALPATEPQTTERPTE